MTATVILGIIVSVFAGLVVGICPFPIKFMRSFKYEHFGFISMLVGLFILPWLITIIFCPDVFTALSELDMDVLFESNMYSFAWGIANVLSLICFVKIGVALTDGILCSFGTIVGVTVPMIFKASGIFEDSPDIISKAGMTVMFGVAVMLIGVYIATLSGFGREKMQKEKGIHEGTSGGFAIGLIMAIISGILSAGWGFAFVYSQGPIIDTMKSHGAGDFGANMAVWAFVLFSAVIANVGYPMYLMSRNRSWNVLSNPREIGLSVIFGVLFLASSMLMGIGMIMLGALGASVGVGITLGMQIVGGAGLGFISGEYRGVYGKPRIQIYVAILIILIAAAIMSYGNSMV